MDKILVFGASGHAKVIADSVRHQGLYEIECFIDNVGDSSTFEDRPVFCEDFEWEKMNIRRGVIAVGDNWKRSLIARKIIERSPSFEFVTVIHPSAVIGSRAIVGAGSVVFAGAVLNPDAKVGNHCIINTRSSIDHDCVISDFASVAPGAILGGSVKVGVFTSIGLGASVIHGIEIAPHVVVGAGAAVVNNLPELVVATGVPCRAKRSRSVGEPYLTPNATKSS